MIKIKRFSVFNDSILKCNESVIDGDFIVKRLESANDFMRNDTSIRNMVDMNKSEEDLLIRLFGDYNMTKGMVPKVKVGNFYEDSGVCFARSITLPMPLSYSPFANSCQMCGCSITHVFI